MPLGKTGAAAALTPVSEVARVMRAVVRVVENFTSTGVANKEDCCFKHQR
jgi:hypothetical protein